MIDKSKIAVFALDATHNFGEKIVDSLGLQLSEHEEIEFKDGEHKSRSLVNVDNKNVYVIQSLYKDEKQSVNDKLCRLLFFIGALKDSGAAKITAIVPYLCYARIDRQTKLHDPVTTRYVASLFEVVGTDRIITADVHNLQAFQNAFRCYNENLAAHNLFVNYFRHLINHQDIVVMSPDIGGVKRAMRFRRALSQELKCTISFAFMEKNRNGDVLSGETIAGDVKNKVVIIFDDLISTGGTLIRTAQACHKLGAKKIYAAATHGAFVSGADVLLNSAPIEKIVVSNTINQCILENAEDKLIIIDSAPLFAQAIKNFELR